MNSKKYINLIGLSLMLVLSMVLAACGSTPPAASGFSLLASGGVSAAQGSSNTVTLTVKRSGDFAEAVDLGIEGIPAGVNPSFSANPVTGDSSTLTLEVGTTTAMGSYPLTVKGIASGMEKTATVVLEVTSVATQVDHMSIKNYDESTQVAQGNGMTLELSGKGLASITQATLGGIDGSINQNWDVHALLQPAALSAEDTASSFISIYFNIPHGESMGPKTLTLVTPEGSLTVEDAVTVTPVTISPAGNDATGRGTPDSPYRSLYHVFYNYEAREGDTVRLLNGSYSTASGETLPVQIRKDVIVEGESQTGVRFEGNSTDTCLKFQGSGSLTNMTVSGCNDAVEAKTGTLSVSGVTFKDNVAVGLNLIEDAVVNVADSSFSGNDIGVEMTGNSKLTMTNSELTSNVAGGIHAKDNADLKLTSSNVSENNVGLFLENSTAATLSDNQLDANTAIGIAVTSDNSFTATGGSVANSNIGVYIVSPADITASVSGLSVNQNAVGFAYISVGGSLKMRTSSITNSVSHGLIIGGSPAEVDLGSAADAGKNSFNDNDGFQLFDARPALAAPNGTVISAIGNKIGGLTMVSGLQTGVAQNVFGTNNYWRINNANQRIEF